MTLKSYHAILVNTTSQDKKSQEDKTYISHKFISSKRAFLYETFFMENFLSCIYTLLWNKPNSIYSLFIGTLNLN